MITITPTAAEQIHNAAKQGQMESMPLRLAATKKDDGSIHYGMGFDDQEREDDIKILSEGINIVISAVSQDLLKGTTLDYVEIEEGNFNFIFINPNDPSYTPPPGISSGTIEG